MFRLKAPSRRAVAASLLVVFLNVFVGQAVCALAMPAASAAGPGHHHPAGTPPHHHAHPAPGVDHHATAQQQHRHEHEHEGPTPGPHKHGATGGACCQDDAAAVWAALAHPPQTGVDKMAFGPVAQPLAPFAPVVCFEPWGRAWPVWPVARGLLKPKIPDIRIFIQSLTV